MPTINLEENPYGDRHIECPHCKGRFNVRWDTDCGDAVIGEHKVKCTKCGKEIEFGVYLEYTQVGKRKG
jgi:predicted Zn finger-like uncharacterized protein